MCVCVCVCVCVCKGKVCVMKRDCVKEEGDTGRGDVCEM